MTPIYIDPEIAIYAATAGAAFAATVIAILGAAAIITALLIWCGSELPYLCYRVRKWADRKWRA